ncbi:MAG TPA: SusC/RagA family TonB-linked outer membrane protein, partial [Cyclobacteriaceae bacterium]|nr:SusC/RagA family TonB-linked outer membrane protein [Cyclobacteriaceae bacterium]
MKITLPTALHGLTKFIMGICRLAMLGLSPGLVSAASPVLEVNAVDVTVRGTVTDSNGEPIPGVTVSVPGTTIGTATDLEGRYSLTVPEGSSLAFSFIGFQTQTVSVGDRSVIDITLAEDMASLDEVVVVGYGVQKRANVIGSVSTVNADEIMSQPVSGVSNMLAGRLPGGTFTQESGQPGKDNATIRIRGNSTLGNNSPLIVVDGIVGRDINTLQPENIESITMLKDASAAIYGASGANGVILITTKRGAIDTPATVTYRFHEGILTPTMLPEMADAPTYARMIREYQSYRGTDESNMRYSLEDIAKYESGEFPWTHPNTNWYDEALRDFSSTRQHNLSISGGSKSTSYYTSFGYNFNDGIYTNNATSYDRYNLKVNIDYRISDYISLGLDLTGVKEDKMYSPYSESSIFDMVTRMWPTSPAVWPGGLPGPDFERGLQPMVLSSDKTGFDDDKNYRTYSTFSANIKIPGIEGLSLNANYAYDLYQR